MIDLRDFDFPLPEHLIAKYPASNRENSRLFRLNRKTGEKNHLSFRDLGSCLVPGDVLVINDTKVIKARISAKKELTGRDFEILLTSPLDRMRWECLVRPGKHIPEEGTVLQLPGGWEARIHRDDPNDRLFTIQFPPVTESELFRWLDTYGEVPLPPYLKRDAEFADAQAYQTVFASRPGSVAAPTAGLHFTENGIGRLKEQGVQFEKLTLSIGYGTFGPLSPEAEKLHPEHFEIDTDVLQRLKQARSEGRRVIAVGTTSLRALESAKTLGNEGTTDLFIRPGYTFTEADGLLTNFHLPQSSLFVLVCAFLGTKEAQEAYREAIEKNYRFFSFGDAMLLV